MSKKRTNIYLMLIGGLGNQMFEYAFARNLNLQIPNSKLIIDTISYKKYKLRKFELHNFNIPPEVEIRERTLKGLKSIFFGLFKLLHKIEYKLLKPKIANSKYFPDSLMNRNLRFGMITCYDRFFHKIDIEKLKNKRNIYIFGYFQSPQYFVENKKTILSELQPIVKTKEIKDFCENTFRDNHIFNCFSFRCSELKRLGLFLEDFNSNYFEKATLLLRKISKDKTILLTEDPKSAEVYLKDFNEYISAYSFLPHEQLFIMSKCSIFVVSNSSFSWWGSFLSNSKSKVVIAPKFWYKGVKTEEIGIWFDDMLII